MTAVGTRVWVVRDANDEQVNTYGYGTYVGDHLMPGWDHPSMLALCEKSLRKHDAQPLFNPRPFYDQQVTDGKMTREEADAILARGEAYDRAERARPLADRVLDSARQLSMNPRIELDAGGWVWGAECWWGEADDDTPIKYAKGRRILVVAAPDGRAAKPDQCPHCASDRREWRFEMPNGDRVENCANTWHDGVQAVVTR